MNEKKISERFACIRRWPRALIAVLIVGIFSLTGCLPFGHDTEVLAPNVTAQHLQRVGSLTGIQFPDGSTGLAYLYLGSGIDHALAMKVAIPSDKKATFLQNEIFQKGSTNTAEFQIGKSKTWWKIKSLTDRSDRTLELPQGRFVECTLGVEDGKLVAYISWHST